MRLFRLFALLALSIFLLQAQSNFRVTASSDWRITGYVLTTSPVSVATLVSSGSMTAVPPATGAIVWLCGADVNASAGTAATVTIKDGAGAYFWNAIAPLSSTAASSFNVPFGTASHVTPSAACRPFPGGMLVSASAGSTITFSGWGVF